MVLTLRVTTSGFWTPARPPLFKALRFAVPRAVSCLDWLSFLVTVLAYELDVVVDWTKRLLGVGNSGASAKPFSSAAGVTGAFSLPIDPGMFRSPAD